MRKLVVAVAVCVGAMVVGALAVANPASDTQLDLTASAKPSKAGTKENPRPVKLGLNLKSSTKSGTGQGETSDVLVITIPRQWIFNIKLWPKGAKNRCDAAKANSAKSDNVCPKKSKVGGTTVVALAGNGAVERNLLSGVYILTNGKLGLWVESKPGESPQVAQMIPSSFKGKSIRIPLPKEIKEPVAGLKSAIKQLVTKDENGKNAPIGGTFKRKGETRGLFESTGCPKGGWTVGFTKETPTGDVKDTDKVPCTAAKKKR
jgi:hypothetical protein